MDQTPDMDSSETGAKMTTLPLWDRASRTMKVLWTGLGALATLGGVVGLFQVLSMNALSDKSAEKSGQEKIIEMVQSGDVSLEEAERLARVLYGDESAPDGNVTEAIQTLATSGSARQKEAIQMIGLRHSREEGFDILEAEAKTSDDWLLLAELSYGRDIERSLKAIRKSIALNPDNFRAVALLSQIQARKGDYTAAERSAKTAEMLADTSLQKVMATTSTLGILISAGGVADMPDAIAALEREMAALEAQSDIETLPETFASKREMENHPAWAVATSHQILSSAKAGLRDFEAANEDIERSIALYEQLLKSAPQDDRTGVMRRISGAYDVPIFIAYSEENFEEVAQIGERQLEIARRIAETGDARGIADLPRAYSAYSGLLFWAKEGERSLEAMDRAVTLSRAAADRRPDDADLAMDHVQFELSKALLEQSLGKEGDLVDRLDTVLTDLETALTGTEDEETSKSWGRYRSIVYGIQNFFKEYETESTDKIAEDLTERAIGFLNAEIASRPDAHDPRHTRFYILFLQASETAEKEGYEAGRAAYRNLLIDAEAIPPTEEEPDVVELSRLTILHSIVILKGGNVEPKDRPELEEALSLARSLDAQGKLTTRYQQYLNDLISIQDGTKVWDED